MAEVQTTSESGEMTQIFIEFIMMQAQNAALFLGQIPNPQSGKPEVNLDLARMFIDQLLMVREKTRGNLNKDEQSVLNNAISNLQLAFVEVSKVGGPSASPPAEETPKADTQPPSAPPAAGDAETKKKFTKSYGS